MACSHERCEKGFKLLAFKNIFRERNRAVLRVVKATLNVCMPGGRSVLVIRGDLLSTITTSHNKEALTGVVHYSIAQCVVVEARVVHCIIV